MRRYASLIVLALSVLIAFFATVGLASAFGPDVIVGALTGPSKWGTIGDVTSYSIGTTSCNIGNQNLSWLDNSPFHPVIAQNMYRLEDGRFEQIGMSWLKHGFCALQGTLCGPCTPAGGGCSTQLGIGCSDPYGSGLNGSQPGLGPRSEVNASTGVFPWPFSTAGQTGNTLYKRIQVANSDLDPALHPGALYFGEAQYVTQDDAAAGNGNNNASYRKLLVGSLSGGGYNVSWDGATVREFPAIQAWKDLDPGVKFTHVDVPGDGRFWVGTRVTDNGNGTWHYEYAIQNLNSHRSAGALSIPLGPSSTALNVGFHDVDYHSGEPYDNTDWTINVALGSSVTWSSPQTHAQNPDSNALRWGTVYNFRFDSNGPPVVGTATLSLFRPGTPNILAIATLAPGIGVVCTRGDINDDGSVNALDIDRFVQILILGGASPVEVCAGDLHQPANGVVGFEDVDDFVVCLLAGGCQ